MKKSTAAKKAMKKGMNADGMKTGAQTAKKAMKKSTTTKKATRKGMTDRTARLSGDWGFAWLDFLDHLEREGRS